jgi:L-lactate dehydrogenase complex protein LldE
MRAALLITCLGDMFYPEVGVAIVRLLRSLGVSVDFPAGQTCCGLPLFNSGYHRDAARVARRTVAVFRDAATPVVVPSGSCAWMLRKEYPGLLKDDPLLGPQARALASRTYELSQFLVRVLGVTRLSSTFAGRATYHDSCHLLRGLGEAEAPRTLLRNLDGVDVVDLPDADQCCGFGGSFSVRLPEVSSAILDKKVAAIESTGADCLVACDAGCLMQIGGRLTRQRSRVRAVHLAELLAPGASR